MKHRTIVKSASRWHIALAFLGLASTATGCGANVSGGGGGGGGGTSSTTNSTSAAPSCTCSASTPAAGATCDDTACADVLCYYDNGCGQLNEWHCKDGLWKINTDYSCPSCTCPASTPPPPTDGTWSCDDTACAGVLCYYDNGCGQLNEWQCKEGRWQINSGSDCPSCTCPASTPPAGATCDNTACADVFCYFDNGCGQLNEWHCKDDLWQINTWYACP